MAAAHQDVPDVLVGPLVAAEADAGTQQPLAPPQGAGHHLQLPQLHGLGAVHLHPHRLLRAGPQQLLQLVVLLILWVGHDGMRCGELFFHGLYLCTTFVFTRGTMFVLMLSVLLQCSTV